MPLVDNLPNETKASIFDFWATAWSALGIEPVFTKNPASMLILDRDAVDLRQVEALRAIAGKYLTYADKLEAEIRRLQPVAPQNGDGPDGEELEDDMPAPLVQRAQAPTRRRAARGTDGQGGPVPPPVVPRVRGQ